MPDIKRLTLTYVRTGTLHGTGRADEDAYYAALETRTAAEAVAALASALRVAAARVRVVRSARTRHLRIAP